MTARPLPIDARLRRAARAAIFGSPALLADFRRAKQARRLSFWKIAWYCLLFLTGGPMIAVIIPMIVVIGIENQWGADGLLAVGAALSTVVSLGGAQFFLFRLRTSKAVSVQSHLPTADARIAREIWREIALWSLFVLYPGALAVGYLAWKNAAGWGGGFLAALVVLMHWLTCLATGTTLAVFVPRFPFKSTCFAGILAGILYAQAGAPNLADVTLALYVLVPAGWVNAVFGLAFLQQAPAAWWAGAAALVWIGTSVLAIHRLLHRYTIRELSFPPDSEPLVALASPFDQRLGLFALLCEWVSPSLAKRQSVTEWELSEAEAEGRIRSGLFLRPTIRPRGQWIERVVDRWLTDRERVVLELLTANRSRWSENWWTMVFCGLVIGVVPFAAVMPMPGNLAWACILVADLLVFCSMGLWPGLLTKQCAGAFVTWHSVLPIGFNEISTVMFKVGLVRNLFAFGLVILLAVCGTAPQILNGPRAVLAFAVYAILLIVVQGWIISFHLSVGLRYPDLRLRTVIWHALPIVFVVGSLSLGFPLAVFGAVQVFGAAQVVPQPELYFAAGILVLCGSAWGNWRLLKWMHDRGLVDFVRNRRASYEEPLQVYDGAALLRHRNEELRRRYGWLYWLGSTKDAAPVNHDQ